MSYLTSIAILILLFINLRIKNFDILYPATIYCFIWFLIILLYSILSIKFNPIDTQVLIIILSSCLCFTFGCFISSGSEIRQISISNVNYNKKYIENITIFLLLLSILILYLIIVKAKEITAFAGTQSLYFTLRNTLNYGDKSEGFGALKYLFTFTYFTLIYLIIRRIAMKVNIFPLKMILLIILAIIMAILSTSRTQVITVFLFIILPLYYFRKINLLFSTVIMILIFLPLSFILSFYLGKFDYTLINFTDTILSYIVAPLVAFSSALENPSPYDFGINTFRFINAFLYSIGLSSQPVSMIQPFTSTPIETNLYTSFLPYYLDFGIAGILIIQLYLGFFYGYIYKLVTVKNLTEFNVYLFLLSLIPLASTYSTETYFLQLSLWIQYFFWGKIFWGNFFEKIFSRKKIT